MATVDELPVESGGEPVPLALSEVFVLAAWPPSVPVRSTPSQWTSTVRPRQAAIALSLLTVVQIAWGVMAGQLRHRAVAFVGIAVNGAALVGWALAVTTGIGFVEGLDVAENPGFANGMAAALAALALADAAALSFRSRRALVGIAVAAVFPHRAGHGASE